MTTGTLLTWNGKAFKTMEADRARALEKANCLQIHEGGQWSEPLKRADQFNPEPPPKKTTSAKKSRKNKLPNLSGSHLMPRPRFPSKDEVSE